MGNQLDAVKCEVSYKKVYEIIKVEKYVSTGAFNTVDIETSNPLKDGVVPQLGSLIVVA